MAALDDLLARINDPALRADIEAELAPLRGERELGLVFERHMPEKVRLHGLAVRRGASVELRADPQSPTWEVIKVVKGEAHLRRRDPSGAYITDTQPADELVVVREFGQPIYPGLKSEGRIERGGDKPFHTVINSENFHALEMLQYTHSQAVDVVLIDPPYNTGTDSWSYSDNFIDANDGYRHSKWLAFMERRLELARRLLKPAGLLLIHIDDSEQARLKLLCDQVMGHENFIATTVWKSKSGGANDAGLAVDHEYILIYRASAQAVMRPDSLATSTTSYNNEDEKGRYALERLDKQNLQYSKSMDYDLVAPDGTVYKLAHKDPKKPNAIWRWSRERVKADIDQLVFKDGCVYTKNYEKDAYIARSVMSDERFGRTRTGGSDLKSALGAVKAFDYPKPVKLLEHLLRISAGPDAVVLDFFGGSGTTSAACMSLNAQDGGRRTSILITNNEVSKKQASAMRKRGIVPGDGEWEDEGVFRKVCMPRLTAEVQGKRPDGYQFSDGFEENIEFFTLTYEDPDHIRLGAAFSAVAPLLWLIAGAAGPRIDRVGDGWALPDGSRYGVLFDADRWQEFAEAVKGADEVTHAFIITDSDAVFQRVAAELPDTATPVRLYESYLRSFAINTGVSE